MKWITTRLNEFNLESALKRSELEFFPQSKNFTNFKTKYLEGVQNDLKILYTEGFEGLEVASSFILVFTHINLGGKTIKVCFLTQVIISAKFRKQKRIYSLIAEADKLASVNGAVITFVIARRSVADIYYKCGYSGFSHFSAFYAEKKSDLTENEVHEFREAKITDTARIKFLYEETYKDLNFFFPRSINTISNLINRKGFDFYINRDNECYFVSYDGRIIEVGLRDNHQFDAILRAVAALGINKFELNRNHRVFGKAISNLFQYVDRFEEKEGHLLRIHESNFPTAGLSHPIAIGQDQYVEICEMDQW